MWILRHAFAIAVLPVTMTTLIPLWVCRRYGVVFRAPASLPEWACLAAGVVLAVIGGALFVTTVSLFATEGKGTLAPWDPPAHLVVRGPYRFVRNPMISGVILIILAESLILRSLPLAQWAGTFLLINMIYIPLFEEPFLEQRFGEGYRSYKRHVRRFLPQLRPWQQMPAESRR
jgi:protein-S-isoprenylcysteine O-methyltransferase Ste14